MSNLNDKMTCWAYPYWAQVYYDNIQYLYFKTQYSYFFFKHKIATVQHWDWTLGDSWEKHSLNIGSFLLMTFQAF